MVPVKKEAFFWVWSTICKDDFLYFCIVSNVHFWPTVKYGLKLSFALITFAKSWSRDENLGRPLGSFLKKNRLFFHKNWLLSRMILTKMFSRKNSIRTNIDLTKLQKNGILIWICALHLMESSYSYDIDSVDAWIFWHLINSFGCHETR